MSKYDDCIICTPIHRAAGRFCNRCFGILAGELDTVQENMRKARVVEDADDIGEGGLIDGRPSAWLLRQRELEGIQP